MKDPERIRPLLKRLERAWTRAPDLRLGQLVWNTVENEQLTLYYVEDDQFLLAIEAQTLEDE